MIFNNTPPFHQNFTTKGDKLAKEVGILKSIRGKRLTLAEKKIIKQQGYEPSDFLRRKKTAECYIFIHRITGAELPIRR